MKKKPQKLEIEEKVVFEFAYEESAKNVAIALSMAGYFVRVGKANSSYAVGVYKIFNH